MNAACTVPTPWLDEYAAMFVYLPMPDDEDDGPDDDLPGWLVALLCVAAVGAAYACVAGWLPRF